MSDVATWAVIPESFGRLHVVPLHDDYDHITHRHDKNDFFGTGACWCQPKVENNQLFIHNAHDGRQKYEADQYTAEDMAEYGDDYRHLSKIGE
jgi:hypothetical protein